MRTVTIIELPEGGWVRDDCGPTIYSSAKQALDACRVELAEITKATGETAILVINWHPKTRVGRMVVRALQ